MGDKLSFLQLCAVILVLLITSNTFAQYRSDSCRCVAPIEDSGGGFGRHVPNSCFMDQARSLDGKWLSYDENEGANGAYILNSVTREIRRIEVDSIFPRQVDYAWTKPIWSPYDPDLLALEVGSLIDTENVGAPSDQVWNLFSYRVSTKEVKRLTPTSLGSYGPTGMSPVLYWLAGSTALRDTFELGWGGIPGGAGYIHDPFFGFYLPQSQTLIPSKVTETGLPYLVLHRQIASSSGGEHAVWVNNDSVTGAVVLPFYFDDKPLSFEHPIDSVKTNFFASFSPNGKIIAFTVCPSGCDYPGDSIFQQVWICDVSNPQRPHHILNLQCLFCTYNFWLAIDAAFLTDSTLVVSMHKDGEDTSNLYEVAIDGHLVRQLTSSQNSAVASFTKLDFPFQIYPNPTTSSTTISLTPETAGYAEISVVNMLGVDVARVFSGEVDRGEHTFTWDAARMAAPRGLYECIVRMNGKVQVVPVVVE
jgi:hypothetical protein